VSGTGARLHHAVLIGLRPPESLIISVKVSVDIHYRSKVWGHPDNFVFSMRTHTFIYQMSCKMYRKCSQDIDKVGNND